MERYFRKGTAKVEGYEAPWSTGNSARRPESMNFYQRHAQPTDITRCLCM